MPSWPRQSRSVMLNAAPLEEVAFSGPGESLGPGLLLDVHVPEDALGHQGERVVRADDLARLECDRDHDGLLVLGRLEPGDGPDLDARHLRTHAPTFRSPTLVKCTRTVRAPRNWKLFTRRYSRSDAARATTMMTMTLMILFALIAIFLARILSRLLYEVLVDRGVLGECLLAPG